MDRFADLAPQPAPRLCHQMGKQGAKHLARPRGVGVGQRRARRRPCAKMVQPVRMARQTRFDLAQALRARQLPIQQRDELTFRRQPAHPRIRPVRFHQSIEHVPGHVLQDGVEYAILMPHGVNPLPCPETLPDVRKTEESTPCALSTKTQPDSSGFARGMTTGNGTIQRKIILF
jgi:hypothetical protein